MFVVCSFAQSVESELSVNIPVSIMNCSLITLHLACILGLKLKVCMSDIFFGVTWCLSNASHQSLPNASPNLKNIIWTCTLISNWMIPCKLWNTKHCYCVFYGLNIWKVIFQGEMLANFFSWQSYLQTISANYMVFWAFSLKNRLNLS